MTPTMRRHGTMLAFITLTAALPLALNAQQATHSHYDSWSDSTVDGSHAFVFHQGDATPIRDGRWARGNSESDSMERHYAESHAGTYVLFLDGGQLHRLDDSKDMAEVASFHERMRPLDSKQRELSAQQRPLSARMKALGVQMKTAGDTSRMQQLGGEMSDLGKQMSALGALQSTVGQQQGELGRAMHKRVGELIDACLKNSTCPVV